MTTTTVEIVGDARPATVTLTTEELQATIRAAIAEDKAKDAAAAVKASTGGRGVRSMKIRQAIQAARSQGGMACAVFTQHDARNLVDALENDVEAEPCGHRNGMRAVEVFDPAGYPYTTENGRTVSLNPLDDCWSPAALASNTSAKIRA